MFGDDIMIPYSTINTLNSTPNLSNPALKINSITEATFYGKNTKLLKIEAMLNEACAKTHKDIAYIASKEFANKLVTIGDMLAGIFGFTSVSINESLICFIPPIAYNVGSSSGCTLCHSQIFKYTKLITGGLETWVVDIDKNHKGVQFAPGVKYDMRMFLSVDLFSDHGVNSLTGGEILSIILHEIGHNFYVGPIHELTPEISLFLTTGELSAMINSMVSQLILLEGSSIIDSFVSDSTRKTLTQLFNIIDTFIATFSSLDTAISLIAGFLRYSAVLTSLFAKLLNPMTIIKALSGYDPEKYSDAFATSYGYGPELSSSLEKLGAFHIAFSSNQTMNWITNFIATLYRIPLDVLYILIDPHPNTPGRLLNDIKYMEEAGKSITHQKQKAEWQRNLNALYVLRDQAMTYNGIDLGKNKTKVILFIEKFTHIVDPKDLISTLNPKYFKYKNIDM